MRKRIANETEAMYGKEPETSSFLKDSDPEYSTFFSGLMYFYSHATTKDQRRKWFLKYLSDAGKDITLPSLLSKAYFVTGGIYARIWQRGLQNNAVREKLEDCVKNVFEEAEKIKGQLDTKNRIKDIKVKNESKDAISQIDVAIDEIITKSKPFDVAAWIHEQKITINILKAVNLKFKKLREEISDSFTNKELVEAYSNLKKKQKTMLLELLNTLESFKESNIKVRKTRKKYKVRTKSPEKMVSKVKYMPEFKNGKTVIKSITPTKIIGATEIWVFNTKYRILTNLKAQDSAGLSIKGTTIININEEESQAKKIRKPEQVLPEVLSAGKVKLKHLFDDLTTRNSKVTGRLGNESIIVRIV